MTEEHWSAEVRSNKEDKAAARDAVILRRYPAKAAEKHCSMNGERNTLVEKMIKDHES